MPLSITAANSPGPISQLSEAGARPPAPAAYTRRRRSNPLPRPHQSGSPSARDPDPGIAKTRPLSLDPGGTAEQCDRPGFTHFRQSPQRKLAVVSLPLSARSGSNAPARAGPYLCLLPPAATNLSRIRDRLPKGNEGSGLLDATAMIAQDIARASSPPVSPAHHHVGEWGCHTHIPRHARDILGTWA